MSQKTLIICLVIILIIIAAAAIYISLPKPKTEQMTTTDQNQTQEQNSQNPTSFDIQGMTVDILKQGTGDGARAGDNIEVNYVGTLTNGTKFDSSLNPGRTPFTYTLGQNQVIKGWELGLLGMKVGEKRRLTIPPELGYGEQGAAGGAIPPNATLIFEIDMLSINGKTS